MSKWTKRIKRVGKVAAVAAAVYFGAPYLLAAASTAAPYAGAAASLAAARARSRAAGGITVEGSTPMFAPAFSPGPEFAGLGGGGASSQIYPGGGELPSGPSPMMLATIAGVGIAFITLLLAFRR